MVKINSEYLSEYFEKEIFPRYCARMRNARTKKEYASYIRILCDKFIHKDFLDITPEDAHEAFRKMKEFQRRGELSGKTICVRLSCYNAVSRFVKEEFPELEFENPFSKIERPEVSDRIRESRIPSMAELDAILSEAKKEPMYYLILSISTRTGMSASKIIRITKDCVFEESGNMGVVLNDDLYPQKSSAIIFPNDVSVLLKRYLESVIITDNENHIFFNRHGNPLTIKNLDSNIARIVKKAGVTYQYTLKDMRSRAILDMIDAGADEKEIQNYVGIGPIRTRQYYQAKGLVRGCPANLVNYEIKAIEE